jgi:hypothetical protein
MTTDTEILNTIAQMPEPLKQELLHYAKYLFENYSKVEAKGKAPKRNGLGIWKDKIRIADDFDEPLEDFKEYM